MLPARRKIYLWIAGLLAHSLSSSVRNLDLAGDRYRGQKGVRQTRLVVQEVFVPQHGPHDLRHSFTSWFYALTRDLVLLADEGGWAGTKIVERYTHLMPSELVPTIATVWGASHPRIGALPTEKLAPAGEARTA